MIRHEWKLLHGQGLRITFKQNRHKRLSLTQSQIKEKSKSNESLKSCTQLNI